MREVALRSWEMDYNMYATTEPSNKRKNKSALTAENTLGNNDNNDVKSDSEERTIDFECEFIIMDAFSDAILCGLDENSHAIAFLEQMLADLNTELKAQREYSHT